MATEEGRDSPGQHEGVTRHSVGVFTCNGNDWVGEEWSGVVVEEIEAMRNSGCSIEELILKGGISEEDMTDIRKVDACDLSYGRFFSEFMVKNLPVIINCEGNVDATKKRDPSWDDWHIRREWTFIDKAGGGNISLNCDHIRERYGSCTVPVMELCEEGNREYVDMTLEDYLSMCLQKQPSSQKEGNVASSLWYLKDWHFVSSHPEVHLYTNPHIFTEDWLNSFCDYKKAQDYRFVYLGARGTFTPFHCDVFKSYSWSANICGKKRWLFFPPGAEDFFKDKFGNFFSRIDISTDFHEDFGLGKNPREDEVVAQRALMKKERGFRCISFVQSTGQTLFVPSGWYHQVFNVEDTLSVNHNWVNGCNIEHMWLSLKEDFGESQKHIADLKDLPDYAMLCQQLLKGNSGVDFEMFFEFLSYLAMQNCRRCSPVEEPTTLEGLCSCFCNICKYRAFNALRIVVVLVDFRNTLSAFTGIAEVGDEHDQSPLTTSQDVSSLLLRMGWASKG
eukprot:Nk52_evm21s967 gene=Nk52_evmTU21s967